MVYFDSQLIAVEDRPEVLIDVVVLAPEGGAEAAFADGAELLQRRIAASVVDRGSRLDTMDFHYAEREVEQEPSPFREQPSAP